MEQAIKAQEERHARGSYEKVRLQFAETLVPFSCLVGLFLEGSDECFQCCLLLSNRISSTSLYWYNYTGISRPHPKVPTRAHLFKLKTRRHAMLKALSILGWWEYSVKGMRYAHLTREGWPSGVGLMQRSITRARAYRFIPWGMCVCFFVFLGYR